MLLVEGANSYGASVRGGI